MTSPRLELEPQPPAAPASALAAAAAQRAPAAASAPPDAATSPADARAVADAVLLAAWLSISAGAIHAIASVDHFSHYWLYGIVFLVMTYGQVLWGVAVLRGRMGRRGFEAAAVANLAIVAVWVVTRTIGAPFGPEAWDPEGVGAMDIAATLDELVLVAYIAAILRPDLRIRRGFTALLGPHRIRLGVMLCSASVFAALLGGHAH